MMDTAGGYVERLGLAPHPEGGFFRETHRADETLDGEVLPFRYGGSRSLATSILYLLRAGEISAFHRVKSDEIWYYHTGGPLELLTLDHTNGLECRLLGVDAGEQPQLTVYRNTWMAARVHGPHDFCLMSCSVAPGFDFADFELATADTLAAEYPDHRALITELCPSRMKT